GKLRDPGIREHNIESALFFLDLREETIKVAKIRHVSLYARYISADFLYLLGQLRLTSARDEDIRAFVDKRFCRSETNPACAASNQCDFSFKSAHVLPSLILRVPIYCPVTSTMRKRALPCVMRAYASAACSSGNVSIMGRIFSRTLKASVSSLSIGVPVSVP